MSKEQVDVEALFKADGARDKFKKDLAAYHEISFEEASEIIDKADANEITAEHGVRPYLGLGCN